SLKQWKISVAPGERIQLSFGFFDLEPIGTTGCNDYVEVFDGILDGAERVGQFCGSNIPEPLISTSNIMVVRFKSDEYNNAKGFQATYIVYREEGPIITTTTKSTTATTTQTTTTTGPPVVLDSGCGNNGVQQGRKGTIQSKGYPESYPANLICGWNITVAQGFLIKMTVTDLAIEGTMGQCRGDKLEVSDNLELIGSYCGFAPPPVIVSSGNRLSLKFIADSRLADRGFAAKWEAVYPEDTEQLQKCGGTFREESGIIKSQNWPRYYAANSLCMWIIEVAKGKNITLKFTHFEIEEPSSLTKKCFDNVVIYDEQLGTSQKYGPFCGSKLPSAIASRGNRLVMRFYTDFFTEGEGFQAYWITDPNAPPPTEAPPQHNPWDDIAIDWPVTCGRPAIPPQINSRIVNGVPAKPNSWPWQVSMQVWPASHNETVFFHTCGGTLIHRHWVLTAAHCFINYANELHRWQMCLGKHNLTFTEPTEKCFKVLGIYRHENFVYPEVPSVEYDIALVKLDGEVTASDYIDYACLPPVDQVLTERYKCYATGWGDEKGNSLDPKAAEGLNQVALPVIPFETCKRSDYWWFQVKTSMICAGYILPDELKSVCQGDSGGPLVCQSTAGSAVWEVHGITSFGPIGCVMDKKPSVFTRSSAYIHWIEQIIRKNIYDLTTSGCGGAKDLTGAEGNITSMGFPANYENNGSCVWNLKAPPGKVIHLHFTHFSLEDSVMCINDRVSISDELSEVGTHCGNNTPSDLISFSNTLSLQFTSNSKIVDTGFFATWKAVDPSAIPGLSGCGGHFATEQGELVSPRWPNSSYPVRKVCTWKVVVGISKQITIKFTHFELQAVNLTEECMDYVEIYDGDHAAATKGRFCGFLPPPVLNTTGNTAIIRFYSNGEKQYKGFRGYWTTD
uniref:Zgc:154142 n=1 Tax=Latimeria chalumnae TaxID=7897 RepID=H3A3C9_LATCH